MRNMSVQVREEHKHKEGELCYWGRNAIVGV